MSKEEKRALAIAKLAKVFGKNKMSVDSDSEDELDTLEAILEASSLEEAQEIARKRRDRHDSSKRYAAIVRREKTEAGM